MVTSYFYDLQIKMRSQDFTQKKGHKEYLRTLVGPNNFNPRLGCPEDFYENPGHYMMTPS